MVVDTPSQSASTKRVLHLPYILSQLKGIQAYNVSMKLPDVVEQLKFAQFNPYAQSVEDRGFQRHFEKSRAKQAYEYLVNDPTAHFPPYIATIFEDDLCFDENDYLLIDRNIYGLDCQHRTKASEMLLEDPDEREWAAQSTVAVQIVVCKDMEQARQLFDILNSTAKRVSSSHHWQVDASRLEEMNSIPKSWTSGQIQRARLARIVRNLNARKDSPWYNAVAVIGGEKGDRRSSSAEVVRSMNYLYRYAYENVDKLNLDTDNATEVDSWIEETMNEAWKGWARLCPAAFTEEALHTHISRCGMGLGFNSLIPSLIQYCLKNHKPLTVESFIYPLSCCAAFQMDTYWRRKTGTASKYHGQKGREELAQTLWEEMAPSLNVKQFWSPSRSSRGSKGSNSAKTAKKSKRSS